ncbi:MAG TPA: M12 family metallo-peptidase [Flavobacteriales bacterium]|nr:M12 family metallo-peptidase [Flavobacteriales bacterium]
MRAPHVFLMAFAITGSLSAQQPGVVARQLHQQEQAFGRMAPTALFKLEPASPATDALWSDACRKADVLHYDEVAANRLIAAAPRQLRLDIPTSGGLLRLDLEQAPGLADGFTVRRASDSREEAPPPALHYRGIIEGDPVSIVAISIFGGELMGLIADNQGQRVLGPFEKAPKGLHVLYRDDDLLKPPTFACGTADLPATEGVHAHPGTDGAVRTVRCVHWYWEAAYAIYQGKGSVANVTNYLTGLFNQSATLFANDGIDVALQEIYVWDVPSPYDGSSSHDRLYQFGSIRTTFNGDMAHLLDYGGYGGVAWLGTLCTTSYYKKAYSGINSSYSNVPTYSWSVNVVTHEQGHNLGSSHTHACVWNGNNTAIDGCGPSKGYVEGSCPNAGLPAGGGTIMSYCHLVSGIGMNFNLGFGPQPKQRIINQVNLASCLAACGTTCDAPGGLSVLNLTVESGTLSWYNNGAVSYNVRWKEQASGTWTVGNGLAGFSWPITGLDPGTAYEFQVMADCGAAQSDWSPSFLFTTPDPCVDVYEPNETWQTATPVVLPASLQATIGHAADVDHYGFTVTGQSMVSVAIFNLPVGMSLYLLDASGNVLATSATQGSSSQYIGQNVPSGTYYVKVVGQNGAFHPIRCYNMNLNAYLDPCQPPGAVNGSNITWEQATLSWGTLPNATGYDLRWRPAGGNNSWTNVNGLTGPPHVLSGLLPETSYQVQVRSLCSGTGGGQGGGGTSSEYSATYTFTTLAVPCEVSPPIRVSPRLFLEGPYVVAQGLMTDSLRRQGVIPLNEPYGGMGLSVTGPSAMDGAVLATTGNNAIVDWVVVELRDAATGATVLERRAALLQRDGDVVDVDGSGPVGFCSDPGNYRVAVRHRNHLGCMTASAVSLGAAPTGIDLTLAATATYGADARKNIGGVRVLWAGNSSADNTLRYTGNNNDRDPILVAIGAGSPTQFVAGYLPADVNMDGVAKYAGQGNDRDPILVNVGTASPTATRVEQLP